MDLDDTRDGEEEERLQRQSTGYIFTAADYQRGIDLCEQFKDAGMTDVLTRHSLYQAHCDGYEILAWPCRPARFALSRYICKQCGVDRPCPFHDWRDDCCSCGYEPTGHCQAEHLPAGMECSACGRPAGGDS